jgi:glutathione S-transferase
VARSVSAEMHSGFVALRKNLSMQSGKMFPGFVIPEEAKPDIARIQDLWRDCRARYGESGEFLFGEWSIADAMFAPVVLRFQSYGVAMDPVCRSYSETVLATPAMQEWLSSV